MENQSRKITAYIQDLSQKVIENYKDDEYQIELDFSGSIQIIGIRFQHPYTTHELETILPMLFEKGAKKAGQKLNILLNQYQEQIKKGQI